MSAYSKLLDFVNYVWDFYGADDALYPIKGLTKQDIFDAFYVYKHRLLKASNVPNNDYTWGYGDSLDRERVRDIILELPQFSWSH